MEKTVICLFGPQGSGKGTQAKILTDKLGIPHISTGELFRVAIDSKTKLGAEVEAILKRGELVPDQVTFDLLKERLSQNDCANGFILDGYPRTKHQAELLDDSERVDYVVVLDISDQEAVQRLSGRRHDPQTNKVYNLYSLPKPTPDIANRLVQRADDTEEAIKARLAQYHAATEPILEHYKDRVVHINGEQTIEAVADEIARKLEIK